MNRVRAKNAMSQIQNGYFLNKQDYYLKSTSLQTGRHLLNKEAIQMHQLKMKEDRRLQRMLDKLSETFKKTASNE